MSIFNPWVILGFLFAVGASAVGGYHKGVHSEQDRQKLIIAGLNEQARVKEQALVAAVTTTATQLVKANNDAKLLSQKRNTDIATGALKLRVPVKPTVCPVQAAGDPAPASGNSGQATADIQPEIARSLITITDDADNTARRLNACIETYNQVREMINAKK